MYGKNMSSPNFEQQLSVYANSNQDNETHPYILSQLESVVQNKADKVFITWYDHNAKPVSKYTYKQLWDEAELVIAHDLCVNHKLRVRFTYRTSEHLLNFVYP